MLANEITLVFIFPKWRLYPVGKEMAENGAARQSSFGVAQDRLPEATHEMKMTFNRVNRLCRKAAKFVLSEERRRDRRAIIWRRAAFKSDELLQINDFSQYLNCKLRHLF